MSGPVAGEVTSSQRRTAAPALFALVATAALWGSTSSGIKFGLGGFGPITFLTIELVAATVVLWVILLIKGYSPPPSWRQVVLLALFEPALANILDTYGLSRTSAGSASIILGLESLFVVLLARAMLKERITTAMGGAMVLGMLGLIVMEGGFDLRGPGLGDLLVLLGVVTTALYTIIAKGISDSSATLTITAHQFAVASLLVLPLAITDWATGAEAFPRAVDPHYWTVTILVGIFGFALTFLLYNFAITRVKAGTAGVLTNLVPAFGLASAVLVLDEHPSAAQLAGAGLICCAVLLVTGYDRPRPLPSAGPGGPIPSRRRGHWASRRSRRTSESLSLIAGSAIPRSYVADDDGSFPERSVSASAGAVRVAAVRFSNTT
jgi:O-acetylserine/cysteine efflux transporter